MVVRGGIIWGSWRDRLSGRGRGWEEEKEIRLGVRDSVVYWNIIFNIGVGIRCLISFFVRNVILLGVI